MENDNSNDSNSSSGKLLPKVFGFDESMEDYVSRCEGKAPREELRNEWRRQNHEHVEAINRLIAEGKLEPWKRAYREDF